MADELYLFKIHGNHSGQHSECGIHMHGSNLTADNVYVNATDLIASWENIPEGDFISLMPESYEIERYTAKRVVPAGGIEVVKELQDGDRPGSSGPQAASNQLCPVIRLIPPMGVVSAGKFFLPCIAESDINANVVQAGWIANLASLMANILTNFGSGAITWQAAVYSRKLGTYADALTFDTSGTIGFQRRRARPY